MDTNSKTCLLLRSVTALGFVALLNTVDGVIEVGMGGEWMRQMLLI